MTFIGYWTGFWNNKKRGSFSGFYRSLRIAEELVS
jgi:hypothetical protein